MADAVSSCSIGAGSATSAAKDKLPSDEIDGRDDMTEIGESEEIELELDEQARSIIVLSDSSIDPLRVAALGVVNRLLLLGTGERDGDAPKRSHLFSVTCVLAPLAAACVVMVSSAGSCNRFSRRSAAGRGVSACSEPGDDLATAGLDTCSARFCLTPIAMI